MENQKLSNGLSIPTIGFGTWELKSGPETQSLIAAALKAGYRLIDTAKIYGNEASVGAAITNSGLDRRELFITTKLWNDDQGFDSTLQAFETSCQNLSLDYLDLYLIHWPATSRRHESWRAMEQLHGEGRIKSIGVSNYTVDHLKQLLEQGTVAPAINQVEFHPFIYEQQKPLLDFCADHNILIEAYSPINRLADSHSQPIHDIAQKMQKSPQQVVLRWCIQHGTIPLPRSTNADHLATNFAVFDFELSSSDMEGLDSLSDGERVTWDPADMGE